MDMRTRTRKKQQQEAAYESDVEEEDEGRAVPVVSGENKRKRAPRSSSRRVKTKQATEHDEEASGSEDVEQDGGKAENHVEKRRESVRLKIKPLKLRENADNKPARQAERKDPDEEVTPVQKKDFSKRKVLDAEMKSNGSAGFLGPKSSAKKVAPGSSPLRKAQLDEAKAEPVMSPPLQNGKSSPEAVPEGELEFALSALRRIMKTDAAQPFNKPVDPIAQGVPDYFDVIDTPMDFGTISDNLEKGLKYKNATDVYKDIQQVWINCKKYNHKGHPILDLMKKVQKSCSKYWSASGVLRDPKKHKKGTTEGPTTERLSEPVITKTPSQTPPEMSAVTSSDDLKSRPGAGTTNHKESCGCVVCVAVRRRAAREKRAVGLGSARAVKRQIAKLKSGKQDLNDFDMDELDDAFGDQEEEPDHFYPSSYQIPLRPVNPAVLSLAKALFGCKRVNNKRDNPLDSLVSSLTQGEGASLHVDCNADLLTAGWAPRWH